jgi:hypothetical protein
MTAVVEPQASHSFRQEDVRKWLADHGIDMNDVCAGGLTIRFDRRGHDLPAFIDVDWFKRDVEGKYYADANNEAARGRSTIRLTYLPPLVANENSLSDG